jgi:hypothetical protein
MTRPTIRTSNYQKKDNHEVQNFQHIPARPCVDILDFENTFVPAGLHKKIHNHVPN